MVGNAGFILDCSYRKYAVHGFKKDMAAGSPVGSVAESSHFTHVQGAEVKTQHEARL